MNERTYLESKVHYRALRRIAFATARTELQGFVPEFRLADIGAKALGAWREQWTDPHPAGSGGWNWDELARWFQKEPSGFTVSIWSAELLCGMAGGRASDRRASGDRAALVIHNVESAPSPTHPLKGSVALIATAAAERYAGQIDAGCVRLLDPAPEVVPLYVALGYRVVRTRGRIVYCERELDRNDESEARDASA
ncbi:MAG TPA: hypothetical protein VFJ16_27245 [Longimicrobium sp.]|nr:hypothetical protein [Longimicrobium sp.]